MATAAITGVNGFVGSHLAEELIAQGDTAVGVCRASARLHNLEGLELELRHAHVLDLEALGAAFAGCDVVYHVAARTRAIRDEELWRVNAEGTACVARAARDAGVRRLVLISSLAALGPAGIDAPATEAQHPAPISSYGRSKRGGEVEAWRYAGELELVIVRPPIVYGPRDLDNLQNVRVARLGLVIKAGLGREPHFSILHVRDLTRALWLAAGRGTTVDPEEDPARPSGRGIYHVDDGAPVTWSALSAMQARLLGRRPRLVPVPVALQLLVSYGTFAVGALQGRPHIFSPDKVREARQVGWVVDATRARGDLGFAARWGLEEGWTETLAWYREQGLL